MAPTSWYEIVVAGITVAALLVPQGMAYAELAGLPPVSGLYASFVPLLAYALLGSSRQLALGPTATVAVLDRDRDRTPEQRERRPRRSPSQATLALLVGGICILGGLLRGGFVVNFLIPTRALGLRQRGRVGDRGQPAGKTPWL